MGFLDSLMRNIALGSNKEEPLFGGMIPRREVMMPPMENMSGMVPQQGEPSIPNGMNTPIRPSGMDRVNNNMLGGDGQRGPMQHKIDWGAQEIDRDNRKLALDREKFEAERGRDSNKLDLDEREIARKEFEDKNRLDLERDKAEIDQRKQALDEWKSKQPDGEIKVDENGRIFIIDKKSGKSIDTGLVGDHFSEEEKLNLQNKHNIDLEGIRQKNRLELEGAKSKTGVAKPITASQQRVAEDDAAAELARDPKFAWMFDNGIIVFDKAKGIIVDQEKLRASDAQHKSVAHLAEFESEMKRRANERVNKAFTPAGVSSDNKKIVKMTTPTGESINVPEDEVVEAKSKGAKEVSSSISESGKVFNSIPPEAVDDGIELYYNDKGKVIGARNKKNTSISKFEKE